MSQIEQIFDAFEEIEGNEEVSPLSVLRPFSHFPILQEILEVAFTAQDTTERIDIRDEEEGILDASDRTWEHIYGVVADLRENKINVDVASKAMTWTIKYLTPIAKKWMTRIVKGDLELGLLWEDIAELMGEDPVINVPELNHKEEEMGTDPLIALLEANHVDPMVLVELMEANVSMATLMQGSDVNTEMLQMLVNLAGKVDKFKPGTTNLIIGLVKDQRGQARQAAPQYETPGAPPPPVVEPESETEEPKGKKVTKKTEKGKEKKKRKRRTKAEIEADKAKEAAAKAAPEVEEVPEEVVSEQLTLEVAEPTSETVTHNVTPSVWEDFFDFLEEPKALHEIWSAANNGAHTFSLVDAAAVIAFFEDNAQDSGVRLKVSKAKDPAKVKYSFERV